VRDDERNLWWRIGAVIVWPIERLIFRVRVEGTEHVPRSGPSILAFNHTSVLDGPCIAIETSMRCKREIRFLVAAEVFDKRFVGWVLRTFDQIPIRRGHGDRHALDAAIETVRGGAMAAIAPEGRVNEDPKRGLQRIRSGIARIALPSGAAVVPVGVWGPQHRWARSGPNFSRLWRRQTIALVYGEPVFAHGDPQSQRDVDTFRDEVRAAIETVVTRAGVLAEGGQAS
jgi:1-acyl-sn-glycerol-3-phosphate acyltransferase